MTRMTMLATTLLATVSSGIYAADTYRYEAFGGLTRQSIDDFSQNIVNVGGRMYFEDVDVSGLPRSEAAFYQHKSHAEVSYAAANNGGADALGIGVNYYIPNTILSVGADITNTSWDGGGSDSTWNLRLGVAPTQGLLIWTELTEDVDYSERVNVNAKYVTPMNNGTAYGVESSVVRVDYGGAEDASTLFSLAGDYFFTQDTSLGLVGAFYDLADENVTGFGMRAQHFINTQLNLSGSFLRMSDDHSDLDTFNVSLTYRF